MMALKRKLLSSNAGISDKEHRWVNFRKQAKGIKPSPLTSWVDTNGVPGEEGATAPVDWKDLISLDVDPNWTPKIQDPVHFQVVALHHNIRAWEDVLDSPPLAERINSCLWDKVDILVFSQPFTGMYKRNRHSPELLQLHHRDPATPLCKAIGQPLNVMSVAHSIIFSGGQGTGYLETKPNKIQFKNKTKTNTSVKKIKVNKKTDKWNLSKKFDARSSEYVKEKQKTIFRYLHNGP